MKEMWALGLGYQLTLIAFLVGAPAAFLYPVILSFVKWNKTRIGRSLMAKGIALLLVFLQGFGSLYLATHGWYIWFVCFVTWWLAFAVWYQTTTVLHTIREGEMENRIRTKPGSGVA